MARVHDDREARNAEKHTEFGRLRVPDRSRICWGFGLC